MRVLVIDDDASLAGLIEEFLRGEGQEALSAHSIAAGRAQALAFKPNLALLDQHLPDGLGSDLLAELHRSLPACAFVVITALADINGAVEAMRVGADDYLSKPLDLERLRLILKRHQEAGRLRAELEQLRRFQLESYSKEYLHLPDEKMDPVYRAIEKVADLERVAVLVEGERGTGKEHVARLTHFLSKRAGGPFVEIQCGAVPESLLERELFGYEAGAFNGATKAKSGLLETAYGGTLFLDEIGELPLGIQAKLHKALEERLVRRLGGASEIRLDLRVVTATHRNLEVEVKLGHFRRDLYFGINGFKIHLPPLRQRPADIRALAQYFLDAACKDFGCLSCEVPAEVLERLSLHPWPGNVRELKNFAERLVIARQGNKPDWQLIEELLAHAPALEEAYVPAQGKIRDLEWRIIQEALRATGGNRTQAAERLGITRKTLFNKLKRWATTESDSDNAAEAEHLPGS